uniref:Uncharacterized protein n=1 Tax=Acrobeloides nanus TaxID=290746 RepID=A0A914EKW0_9BILA
MFECPGDTFADQIRYRRKWYSIVDSRSSKEDLDNPNEFLRELPVIPELATFAQVEHQISPLFSTKEPFILQDLEDINVKIGDPIRLICKFSSEEKVTTTWKRPNGENEDVEVETNETSSTLLIPESTLSDSGQYIITLENEYGKCSSICWITVITPPGTPLDFTYERLPNEVIKLKWSAPTSGNSQNLWYTMEYKREDMSEFQKAIHGITQHAIKISQLQQVIYKFRVYAFNEFFCGEPSEEIVVNMNEINNKNLMEISLD